MEKSGIDENVIDGVVGMGPFEKTTLGWFWCYYILPKNVEVDPLSHN